MYHEVLRVYFRVSTEYFGCVLEYSRYMSGPLPPGGRRRGRSSSPGAAAGPQPGDTGPGGCPKDSRRIAGELPDNSLRRTGGDTEDNRGITGEEPGDNRGAGGRGARPRGSGGHLPDFAAPCPGRSGCRLRGRCCAQAGNRAIGSGCGLARLGSACFKAAVTQLPSKQQHTCGTALPAGFTQ